MNEMTLLGLNEHEAKIYRILMVSGQLSKGEIRFATQLPIPDTDAALSTLISKKLIREVPGLQGRYAAMLPIGTLKTEIEASIQLIDLLDDDLKNASANVITDLKQQFTTKIAEFNDVVTKKQTELNTEISTLSTALDEERDTTVKNSNEKINELSVSSQKDFQIMQEGISSSIVSQITQSAAVLESQKNNLTTDLQSTKQAISVTQSTGKAEIPAPDTVPIDELASSLNTATTNFQEVATKSIDDSVTSINQTLDGFQAGTTAQLNKLESVGNAYQEDTKILGKSLQEHSSTLFESTKSATTSLTTEFQAVQRESITTLQTLSTAKAENIEQIKSALNNLQTAATAQKTAALETLQNNLSGIQTDVGSLIESTNSQYSTHLNSVTKNLTTTLQQQIDNLSKLIEEQFTATLAQTKQQLAEFNSGFVATITDLHDKLETEKQQKVTDLQTSVQAKVDTLQNGFSKDIADLQANEQETFTSTFTVFASANDAYDEQLKIVISNLEALVTKLDNVAQNLSQQNEEIHTTATSEITATVTKHEEAFATNFATALTAVSTQLNDELSKLKTALADNSASANTALQSAVATMQQTISDTTASMKQAVAAIHEQTISRLHTAVDASVVQLNSLADKSYEQSITQIDKVVGDVRSLESSLQVIVDDAIQSLGAQFTDVLSGIQKTIQSQVSTAYSKFAEHQQHIQNIGSSALTQATSLISAETDGQIATVQNSLNTYNAKYKEVTEQVTTPISALAKILGTLEGEVESTDTPTIKTTHVVGKEAILEYITDFIGRIKSKATLLVPSVSMIDDNAIMKLRSTTKIDIISHIDEVADRDWIEKMQNAPPNVTIRTIMDRIGGGSLPDFIGCEREGEEILLGTIDEGNNDYVAIASASEYFVKILGNIVIADYARGKSKQINM